MTTDRVTGNRELPQVTRSHGRQRPNIMVTVQAKSRPLLGRISQAGKSGRNKERGANSGAFQHLDAVLGKDMESVIEADRQSAAVRSVLGGLLQQIGERADFEMIAEETDVLLKSFAVLFQYQVVDEDPIAAAGTAKAGGLPKNI